VIYPIDRFPVVFTMYNEAGQEILREERVLPMGNILSTLYVIARSKPDTCVRFTVDIAFPYK